MKNNYKNSMDKERFEKIKIPFLNCLYLITSISDSAEINKRELIITLSNYDRSQKEVLASFCFAYSYSSLMGSLKDKKRENLKKVYGRDYLEKGFFFEIINSRDVKWQVEQSVEFREEEDFRHFSFVGKNMILNVFSQDDPKFEIER
jgi:hypothetical protein